MIVSPIINYDGGAVAVRNSGDTFPIDGGSDGIEGSYGRMFSPDHDNPTSNDAFRVEYYGRFNSKGISGGTSYSYEYFITLRINTEVVNIL